MEVVNMDRRELEKDIASLVGKYSLDKTTGVKAEKVAKYILACLEALGKANDVGAGDEDTEAFINRMYDLYPTKCPKRNTSLGKSYKDKDRLRKLLKRYSFEEIERVIRYEVESKYEVSYMQNFSTFLNNFPDPDTVGEAATPAEQVAPGRLIIDGQEYR